MASSRRTSAAISVVASPVDTWTLDRIAADLRQRAAGECEFVVAHARWRRGAQPFLPAIRAISALTSRSTISGRLRSIHSASIGRSMSRTRPSSDVSPERTICGGTLGSEIIAHFEVDAPPALTEDVRELARNEGVQVLHKPLKPAALRALLAQWRVLRVAAAE